MLVNIYTCHPHYIPRHPQYIPTIYTLLPTIYTVAAHNIYLDTHNINPNIHTTYTTHRWVGEGHHQGRKVETRGCNNRAQTPQGYESGTDSFGPRPSTLRSWSAGCVRGRLCLGLHQIPPTASGQRHASLPGRFGLLQHGESQRQAVRQYQNTAVPVNQPASPPAILHCATQLHSHRNQWRAKTQNGVVPLLGGRIRRRCLAGDGVQNRWNPRHLLAG